MSDNGEKYVTWHALKTELDKLREDFKGETNTILTRAFNSLTLLVAIAALVVALR